MAFWWFWSFRWAMNELMIWMDCNCDLLGFLKTASTKITAPFLLTLIRTYASKLYSFSVPPSDKYSTRPFLKWVRTQGYSPYASGKIQKYPQPRVHPAKGHPQTPGNKQQTIRQIIGELKLVFQNTALFCCIAVLNKYTHLMTSKWHHKEIEWWSGRRESTWSDSVY